jgi:hypothetical protein
MHLKIKNDLAIAQLRRVDDANRLDSDNNGSGKLCELDQINCGWLLARMLIK